METFFTKHFELSNTSHNPVHPSGITWILVVLMGRPWLLSWSRNENFLLHSAQFSIVAQSCPTLCNPMGSSMPGFPVHRQLPELAQIHVHHVGDAIQSSHPLLSLLILPSIFPSIRVFFNESVLCIRWPKDWSFSFSISPTNEYSRLISLGRMGWISLQSKGLSRVFSNITVQKHQFFGTQPSLWSDLHIYT